MKRKRKEITDKTRSSRVSAFIGRSKFFKPKQFKNTVCYWAAYDSWAARGQAGGCLLCSAKHYNCSFQEKRRTTLSGQKPHEYHWNEFGKICTACFEEIEKQLNYKFTKF